MMEFLESPVLTNVLLGALVVVLFVYSTAMLSMVDKILLRVDPGERLNPDRLV